MRCREVWRLGDEELPGALRVSQDRLNRGYADQLVLVAEMRARGLVEATGYRHASRLPQDLLRISRPEATRRLAHAAAVTAAQPVTGSEHVEVIRKVITALPPDVHPADRDLAERTLAEAAHTHAPAAIAKLGRAVQARLDQDGSPPTDRELHSPLNELHSSSETAAAHSRAARSPPPDRLVEPRSALRSPPQPDPSLGLGARHAHRRTRIHPATVP